MQKWDVLRIFCSFLPQPHDKFCICICPVRRRFFFVNSEPPQFRRARDLAVSIENYEAQFLTHLSYVDTTNLLTLEKALVDLALTDPSRQHGALSPSLRKRIQEGASSHNVLHEDDLALVLD